MGTDAADQYAGRSQPWLVRTHSGAEGAMPAELLALSTRHDNMPMPTSSKQMPTMRRMGRSRGASAERSVQHGGGLRIEAARRPVGSRRSQSECPFEKSGYEARGKRVRRMGLRFATKFSDCLQPAGRGDFATRSRPLRGKESTVQRPPFPSVIPAQSLPPRNGVGREPRAK